MGSEVVAYWHSTDVLGWNTRATFPIRRSTSTSLELDLDPAQSALPDLARTYTYVEWDADAYLVPTELMQEFCFETNDRSHPRRWNLPFLQRSSYTSWARSSAEPVPPPDVPPEFRRYVLPNTVDGVVLDADVREVEDEAPRLTATLRFSVGREMGLLPGMYVFLVGMQDWGRGEIVTVGDGESTASFRRRLYGEEARRAAELSRIPVGTGVSTSNPRQR